MRRPRVAGEVRLDAGRLEVDQILQLFYDPYSIEALPDVVSAERGAEGSGSAEEATQQALARAQEAAGVAGRCAAAEAAHRRRPAAVRRPSSSTFESSCPTTSCCAARSCGRAVRPARRSAT